ncbi:MAG: Ig-like domain repeat protein, partial [Lachnospiraceae bacterium]|nr:Ig-like domain repeat protein [Lachnospiraceae bacterium]
MKKIKTVLFLGIFILMLSVVGVASALTQTQYFKEEPKPALQKEPSSNSQASWYPTLSILSKGKKVGSNITAKAIINNPTADTKYEYKFVYSYNNWEEWQVLQDFSSVNQISFSPKKAGTYHIHADIKDSNGNIASRSMEIIVKLGWSCDINVTVPDKKIGTTISATGGVKNSLPKSSYSYKFTWSRNDWQDWQVISEYSSNSSVSFVPKNNGHYTLYMDVMDNFGNVMTKTYDFDINTDWKAQAPTIEAQKKLPGSKVTV